MSEIEKYYNGEIHVDFDDDSLTYKELEELLYYWLDKYKEKELETKRLHSIIKEVREYIESGEYRFREGTDICLYQEGNKVFYMENDELMARKILSILEKENK